MTIASVSSDSLKDQRLTLVSQRRFKTLSALWRFFLIISLAVGLGWMMTNKAWMIKKDSQIEVKGLYLMSPQMIYSLLSLSYPQSLWRLETHQLSQQLEKSPPVANAIITRHLFPPEIVIEVQERQPIAVAQSNQKWGFLMSKGFLFHRNSIIFPKKDLNHLVLKF
ncbi:cell division protein FtsQ/DivIB [Chroococcus sp. FPU101]|uniref:cell division protein FtsQ/DivIB n=1 Tax=Chroococcus sp. FPU101 TaxID=1974212 RepID=UPI001A8E1731|nr:FtsQ-type POTRA domain-containing protein [Chroococcus sp. FPU101]GFE71160.1 hypothetical protein CFPU101_37700 [Chroococcus sp. FPU101]